MRVFVAGLYSRDKNGKEANTIRTLQNIWFGTKMSARLMARGYDVFCPWLDHQFAFYEPQMLKEHYQRNSLAWLEVSDALVVLSGRGMNTGVDREIKKAEELGIPIYYSVTDFLNRDKQ